MQVKHKTFEYEKCIVHVEYTKIPGKEELEEACIRFLKNTMQDRKEEQEDEN